MTFAEELKSFQNTHPFSKMKVDDIEVKYHGNQVLPKRGNNA